MRSLDAGDWLMLAFGLLFFLVGLFLTFDIIGTARRAARGGSKHKSLYSRREQWVTPDAAMSPTSRAGARRMGIAMMVLALIGVAATLTGDY